MENYNLKFKTNKKSLYNNERLFSVDPARFALASLLVKGRILLHKLQARIHGYNINMNHKNKKSPLSRTSFVTSSKPVIHTNPTFSSIISAIKIMSIPPVDKLKFISFITFSFFALSFTLTLAQVPTLSKVRVTYRPDGGVSVTTFVAGACQEDETETECMDREMQKNPELANLPHDYLLPSQLPKDRKDRNKWTGAKGQGVTINHSLVTKNEKMEELQSKLDEELDKNNPNSVKIAKLQRKMEKLKKFQAPNNLIPPEKLADFDAEQNQSFLASVVETVSSAFDSLLTSIQNGFLALKELVTDTLKVGTPEKPAGITVYDQTTKQPYCLIVKDGQLQSLPGECGATPPPAPEPSPPPPATE